jgi:hypothetical protein
MTYLGILGVKLLIKSVLPRLLCLMVGDVSLLQVEARGLAPLLILVPPAVPDRSQEARIARFIHVLHAEVSVIYAIILGGDGAVLLGRLRELLRGRLVAHVVQPAMPPGSDCTGIVVVQVLVFYPSVRARPVVLGVLIVLIAVHIGPNVIPELDFPHLSPDDHDKREQRRWVSRGWVGGWCTHVCMYVCMYVWMDGWMDVCTWYIFLSVPMSPHFCTALVYVLMTGRTMVPAGALARFGLVRSGPVPPPPPSPCGEELGAAHSGVSGPVLST